ncbi:PLP-dependent aminotransferase family protein [Paraburkholderia sp. D15]|uniref:aminotransferase-like domain-containing protein n=1 Tax=Paraburkholderia sp. D15 TaxID=2880218 RepID=UPI0024792E1D|nr:PLP-dependent aminotransferase family protein [Paraburkholderia sp. D15]WGS50436.1 PLP-dependent aminotransferase family protein [Paraburkholderia sp. D15]WKF58347.1 2-aminoadipate transaminase [Paraburkholderia busanensis]
MDRYIPPVGRWKLARRTQQMTHSALRELLKVAERPDMISFAGGLPSPDALPLARVAEVTQRILHAEAIGALQYGPSEGYTPLREAIAERFTRNGSPVRASQVLITTGSQQALDLVARVLIDQGSRVLVETPTYLGAVQAFSQYEPSFEQLASDADGLIPELLSPAQLHDARLLYTQPNFQNPTGRRLPLDRRRQLAQLALETGLLVVEDDPYGELVYEGGPLPPIHSMAPDAVVYLGSFSKILAPGLRVGYLVAPEALMIKLVQAKQASDLHTAGLTQRIAHQVFTEGFLEPHLHALRARYREQCKVMLTSLGLHMPLGVTWTRPEGGMFLWVTLPPQLNALDLFDAAMQAGVAFVPGAAFYAVEPRHNTLRLSFTTSTPEQIRRGIETLGRLVTARLSGLS